MALAGELADAAGAFGGRVEGIGVGVAELVDRDGGVAISQTIAWGGAPVGAAFAHLAPTVVEADVRAAALAEARYSAGRPFDPWLYLTVGTGISACLVQGGRPYVGARGGALVVASGSLSFPCPACGERRRFVLEEYASGPALAARYAAATGRPVASGEGVTAAAAAGDGAAAAIVGSAGEALGVALGWLVNTLDPAAVVIGGGLGLAGGRYWDGLVAETRAHVWSPAAQDLPILTAALGPDAGLIGAACLAGVGRRRGGAEPCPPAGGHGRASGTG